VQILNCAELQLTQNWTSSVQKLRCWRQSNCPLLCPTYFHGV